MLNTFKVVEKIVHGNNCIENIGSELKKSCIEKVLIVSDDTIIKNNICDPIIKSINNSNIKSELVSIGNSEPAPSLIEECISNLSFKPELIIGVGGGSSLDGAKAVSLRLSHDGPLEKYFGMDKVPSPCLPLILIPTTAGTGSEMTSIAVLLNKNTNSKLGIVSDYLYAKAVYLDPLLTVTMPPKITASTGIDALIHAIESYVSLKSTYFTDCVNLSAMKMISSNIRKVYANGQNVEARGQMLYASSMAGMGFSNTQTGIIHAIGHAVPSKYHLPHGLLMAAVAPMGLAYNSISNPEKFAKIYEILGGNDSKKSLIQKAKCASSLFDELLKDLNIKSGLSPYGIQKEDLPSIALTASSDARLMKNNPRQASSDDIETLLHLYY